MNDIENTGIGKTCAICGILNYSDHRNYCNKCYNTPFSKKEKTNKVKHDYVNFLDNVRDKYKQQVKSKEKTKKKYRYPITFRCGAKLTNFFHDNHIDINDFICAICGKQPIEKHHENYELWYSFIPLCVEHHALTRAKHGKKLRLINKSQKRTTSKRHKLQSSNNIRLRMKWVFFKEFNFNMNKRHTNRQILNVFIRINDTRQKLFLSEKPLLHNGLIEYTDMCLIYSYILKEFFKYKVVRDYLAFKKKYVMGV